VTAQTDSRVYNGTISSGVAPVLTGTQYDAVGTAAAQSYDNKHVGTTHVLSANGLVMADGNSGDNYAITYVPSAATGVITAAALTLTAATNTRTYDGTVAAAATPTVSGLQAGDSVTGLAEVYADKHVGSGKTLSVSSYSVNDGNSGNNYSVNTINNTSGVIIAAPLTVTAQTDSRVYNATTSSAVAPVLTSTQYDPVGTAATQSYDNKNVGTSHVLSATGLVMNDGNSGNNYAITYVPSAASGTITAAPLTITAATNSKAYDAGTSAAALPTVSGLVGSDSVTSRAEAYSDRNAGTGKTLAVSAYTVNDGNSGNNYSVSTVNNTTGVITAARLTVTADDKARLQGAANPPLTATYSGFVAGEGPADLSGALVLATAAIVASLPGAYAITAGGQVSSNYVITYVDRVLTVIASGGGGGGSDARLTEAISFASQQGGSTSAPQTPAGSIGPQGVPVRPVYQVDGTGIRLPPGLQR
jgi:hypothetical protein